MAGSARSIILNLIGNDRISRPMRQVSRQAMETSGALEGLNKAASRSIAPKAVNALNASLRTTTRSIATGTKAVGVMGAASSAAFAGIGAGAAGAALAIAGIGIKLASANAGVKKAFSDMKADVTKQAQTLATPFVQPLKQVAAIVSGTFKAIAPQLSAAFKTLAPAIVPLITGVSQAVKNLSVVFQPLAQVGAKILAGLGPALAGLGKQLVAFLTPILNVLNKVGAGLFQTLIGGIGNVLVSLSPLLATLVEVGSTLLGPLLSAISTVVGALGAALRPVLLAIAPVFRQLVGALAPLVSQLVTGLSPILVALAPILSNVFSVLQPVISALISGLQPVIAALVPVVGLLIGALGKIITAVVPILPPLSALITGLVNGLMPVLQPIITAITQVATAIVGSLVSALIQCMPALQQIVLAVASLLPVLTPLIGLWAQYVAAITPVLPPIVRLAAVIVTALVPVLRVVIGVLVKVETTIAGIVIPILRTLVGIISWTAGALVPVVNAIGAVFRWLGSVAKWLWTNAIAPAFRGIAAVAKWLYSSQIAPIFQAIGTVIRWAYNTLIKPVLTAFGAFLRNNVAPAVRWLYANVIRPTWTAVGSVIRSVWNSYIHPAFNAVKSTVSTLGGAFRTAVSAISTAWNRLKSVAKGPVNFLIGTVYDKGIRGLWNTVMGWLQIKGMNLGHIPMLARGGTLDNPMPVGPMRTNGPLAIVGEGRPQYPEYVIPTDPKFRGRAQGLWAAAGRDLGADNNRWLRGSQALGGEGIAFAKGGIIGSVLGGIKKAAGKVLNLGKMGLDLIANPGKIWDRLAGPVLGMAKGTGSSPWAQAIGHIPGKMLGVAKNAALSIVKAFKDGFGGGPVGGGGYAKALAWVKTQVGKPYIWGGVGPAGYDCSGFMSAITNVIHGRSPYSRLFSTRSFGASGGPGGFVRNRMSPFRVGVTNAGVGHMAGTLNGVNVESSGSRGVHIGSGARGWNNSLFGYHYGLKYDNGGMLMPGWTLAHNDTGRPEPVFPSVEAAAEYGTRGIAHDGPLVVIENVHVTEKADVDMLVQQIEFRLRGAVL